MDNQSVFEAYLRKGDKKGAFRWCMDRLTWDPESSELRGMSAFCFMFFGDRWEARFQAVEVLRGDPDQPWALAVLLCMSFKDSVAEEPLLFEKGYFKLDHTWIVRLQKIGLESESRKLVYCLSRFGTPAERATLSEECLVDADMKEWKLDDDPKRKCEKQLQLPLNL